MAKTLLENDKKRLDGIVGKMVSDGRTDSEIRFVVNDFKNLYGKTFGGMLVRDVAKPFISTGIQGRAAFLPDEKRYNNRMARSAETFLGEPILPVKATDPALGTIKRFTSQGFGMASALPLGLATRTGVAVTGQAIKQPFKQIVKQNIPRMVNGKLTIPTLMAEGAIGSGLFTAGQGLQEDKSAGQIIKDTALSTALGGVSAIPFGIAGSTLGFGLNRVKGTINQSRRFKSAVGTPNPQIVKQEQEAISGAWDDVFKSKKSLMNKQEAIARFGEDPAITFGKLSYMPKVTAQGKLDVSELINNIDFEIPRVATQIQKTLDNFDKSAPTSALSSDDFLQRAINKAKSDPYLAGETDKTVSKLTEVIKDFERVYGKRFGAGTINKIRVIENGKVKKIPFTDPDKNLRQSVENLIGDTAREVIDEKVGDKTIRAINAELAKLYKVKNMARAVNGTPIEGGRLTELFTRLIFANAGMQVAGAVGTGGLSGIIGTALGWMGASAFLKMIRNAKFSGPIRNRILRKIGLSQNLDAVLKELPDVEKRAFMREIAEVLKTPQLPAPKAGAPRTQFGSSGTINLPARTESTIARQTKNMGQQNAFAGFAGIEQDEEGNISFDPEKAVAGMLAMGTITSKQGDEFIKKFKDKAVKAISSGVDELIQEAKKYKSAEEFVKAQGTPIYRGQSKSGSSLQQNVGDSMPELGGGKFFATDKKLADKFGGNTIERVSNEQNTVTKQETIKLQEMATKQVEKDISMQIESNPVIEDMALGRPKAFAEYTGKPVVEVQHLLGRQGGEVVYYEQFDKSTIKTKSQLTDIWNKANQTEIPYKETGNLTTKILKDLEGKTTVSKQYILDATNRGELKQVERDLIRRVLDDMDTGKSNLYNKTGISEKLEKPDIFSSYKPFKADPEYAKFYAELKKKYGDYALVNLTAEENTKLIKLSKNNVPAKGTPAPKLVEQFRGTKDDIVTGDELFHATTPDRVDKIASEGLRINTGGREAMSNRGDINPLFFSDSPNHALGFINDLKNEKLIKDSTKGVLLRVRGLPKENLMWDSLGKNNSVTSGGSWSFDKDIPAKYIEIKENGIWKPITDKAQKSDTINVKEFADKVKSELLPLKVKSAREDIGNYRWEGVTLKEGRGSIKNYDEHIYESPISTSAGSTHFGSDTKNYFGHTRIEDMADNKTRRVIEGQTDLYQKGNLEREGDNFSKENLKKLGSDTGLGIFNKNDPFNYKKMDVSSLKAGDIVGEKYGRQYKVNKILNDSDIEVQELNRGNGVNEFDFKKYTVYPEKRILNTKVGGDVNQRATLADSYGKKISQREQEVAKLQQYDNRTSIFRMFREEIKKAAQDGKTKLQFPTGETAMKIEGLGQGNTWHLGYNQERGGGIRLTTDALKVGEEVVQGSDKWIITDVLGDGKFKAVPKDRVGMAFEYGGGGLNSLQSDARGNMRPLSDWQETFDISGKVDTNNPIYKFYEKDVQKYLNKFGGKQVVDENGVSWIEVPIKKEWAKIPVEAFAFAPLMINNDE